MSRIAAEGGEKRYTETYHERGPPPDPAASGGDV